MKFDGWYQSALYERVYRKDGPTNILSVTCKGGVFYVQHGVRLDHRKWVQIEATSLEEAQQVAEVMYRMGAL